MKTSLRNDTGSEKLWSLHSSSISLVYRKMNLNKTNISENVYNIYDAHILVPKKFAQKARQYLSNENIFLNHKPFQKGLVKETKEEALGIPIKYFKVTMY